MKNIIYLSLLSDVLGEQRMYRTPIAVVRTISTGREKVSNIINKEWERKISMQGGREAEQKKGGEKGIKWRKKEFRILKNNLEERSK